MNKAMDKVEQLLIKSENDELTNNRPVRVLVTDHHRAHIKGHAELLKDPAIRDDLEHPLVQRTLKHIQEHLDQL